MKENIILTTLTPIHIGSGQKNLREVDFLLFDPEGETGQQELVMLDPDKVLHIIGVGQVDQWVSCVDNQSGLYDLLKQRKSDLVPEDVSLRILAVQHRGMDDKSNLHEQLHDGMGRPLLPGSSIKGAIRTALFAHFINKNDGDDARNLRNTFSDTFLTRKYFGEDPNHDIMRLLRIGDATFHTTASARSETINMKGNDWTVDKRFTQFIEIIPQNESTVFSLQFDEVTERNAREKGYFKVDTKVLHRTELFRLINQHTRNLIEREIKYWNEQGEPDVLGYYLEKLQDISTTIRQCTSSECVLRLGWGTGFRNMTGDWHINMTDDDYYELIRKLRPRHPEDMPFPKSFRVLADGTPLGFIKLSIDQLS